MKNCTPLRHEAHFEVKNAQSTPFSDRFWKLRGRKSACSCGAKHISKSKALKKTDGLGSLLQVETSKKRAPLWGKARFEVKMLKTLHARTSSGRSDAVSRGRRAGLCTVSKVRKKHEGFVAFPKINDGRRVAFEEDLQRCIFRGRPNTRDMFIRSGRCKANRWCPGRT